MKRKGYFLVVFIALILSACNRVSDDTTGSQSNTLNRVQEMLTNTAINRMYRVDDDKEYSTNISKDIQLFDASFTAETIASEKFYALHSTNVSEISKLIEGISDDKLLEMSKRAIQGMNNLIFATVALKKVYSTSSNEVKRLNALLLLAWTCDVSQNDTLEEKYLTKVIDETKNSIHSQIYFKACYDLAWCRASQNDPESAEILFRQAAAISRAIKNDETAGLNCELRVGKIYERRDPEKAIKTYQDILKKYPDTEYTQDAIEGINRAKTALKPENREHYLIMQAVIEGNYNGIEERIDDYVKKYPNTKKSKSLVILKDHL